MKDSKVVTLYGDHEHREYVPFRRMGTPASCVMSGYKIMKGSPFIQYSAVPFDDRASPLSPTVINSVHSLELSLNQKPVFIPPPYTIVEDSEGYTPAGVYAVVFGIYDNITAPIQVWDFTYRTVVTDPVKIAKMLGLNSRLVEAVKGSNLFNPPFSYDGRTDNVELIKYLNTKFRKRDGSLQIALLIDDVENIPFTTAKFGNIIL